MAAFQREILVRFGHCDAAGWVFYPRYFEMISDFVEDWFEEGLAASAPGLFHHKQLLTPSVHFTVDFIKPTRYGDRLTFNLWTVKVGRTSCELRIEASLGGELRMRVKQVLVFSILRHFAGYRDSDRAGGPDAPLRGEAVPAMAGVSNPP